MASAKGNKVWQQEENFARQSSVSDLLLKSLEHIAQVCNRPFQQPAHIKKALQLIAEAIGADLALLSVPQAVKTGLRIRYQWHNPAATVRIHKMHGQAITEWLHQVTDYPSPRQFAVNELEFHPASAVRSGQVLIVPLIRNSTLIAVLCVITNAPSRRWQPLELMFLQASVGYLYNTLLSQTIEMQGDQLRSLLNNFNVAVIMLDERCRIRMVNDAGRTLLKRFGLKTGSRHPVCRIGRLDLIHVQRLLQQKNKYVPQEINVGDAQYNVDIFPWLPSSNSKQGLQIIAYDVTQLNQLRSRQMHSAKLAALGTMVAGIAHELNNPLTVIIGQAQLNKMKFDDETVVQSMQPILDAAQRAKSFISQVLSYSRGNDDIRELVDVNETIRNMLQLFSRRMVSHRIQLQEVYEPDLPHIHANKGHIQQLILNFVQNAFDALIAKRKEGTILVRTSQPGDDFVRIEVTDTGPGISQNDLAHIWEPFYSTKPEGKGTGLGLSICRQIVEAYNGRISVQTHRGKGTSFMIELPVGSQMNTTNTSSSRQHKFASNEYQVILVNPEKYHRLRDMLKSINVVNLLEKTDVVDACSHTQCVQGALLFVDIKRQREVREFFEQHQLNDWKKQVIFISDFPLSELVAHRLQAKGYRWLSAADSKATIRQRLKQFIVEPATTA